MAAKRGLATVPSALRMPEYVRSSAFYGQTRSPSSPTLDVPTSHPPRCHALLLQLAGLTSSGMTTNGGNASHAAHAASALAAPPPDAGASSPSVAPGAASPAVLSGAVPGQGQAGGTWPEGGSREGAPVSTVAYGSTYGGSGSGGVPQLAARAHAQQRGAPEAAPGLPAVLIQLQQHSTKVQQGVQQQEKQELLPGDAGQVVWSGGAGGSLPVRGLGEEDAAGVVQLGHQQPQQLWDSRVEGLSRDLTALTDEGAGQTPYGTHG